MSAWVERGGPLMWPLLALSFWTLYVVLERALFWWREGRVSPADALGAARRRLGLAGTLDERSVDRLLDGEARRLERGLGWLDTAVTAAPMLGILGTVLGVIQSFEVLAATREVDPLAVSGGVAQALITTATGLVIALVALLPFNGFRARLARRLESLERELAHQRGEGAA